MDKKKVVYLLGSGATHAVVKSLNPDLGLLTADIKYEIETKYSSRGISNIIWNELISENTDVEHLISVLESQHNYIASEKLRRFYRNAIVNLTKKLPWNPLPPNLYSSLIDLHCISEFNEEISSFITLNYENILEKTIKGQFKLDVDYIVNTVARNKRISKKSIKIYKLHGSFNWFNSRPILIKEMSAISPKDALWIPPGVEKRKENYPFNFLWGKVVEDLLHCDVLRIIGCSLSRNDWGLIPVLYTIQRFNQNNKKVEIEIIDYPDTIKTIKNTYKYLRTKGLIELPDVISFYKKQFKSASEAELISEIENRFADKNKVSPFYEWLDAKADRMLSQGIEIRTKRNFLYDLYHQTT